jgi:Zn-dependent M28 family amino/carboxypeptidase
MKKAALLAAPIILATVAFSQWKPAANPAQKAALNEISAPSLRGHVSFLASDALEGRGTPSRGLDVAAEYIAAQFRRAGLEPVGDDGYFQTTEFAPRNSAEGAKKVRNVIGVLRGSDPKLKDTYVLVTAHYDHLGVKPTGEGDRIYNGANDNASGTASVMEVASALSKLKQRPKRSIVFMTFWGEERGLRGSRYYGANPVFPIEKTVANVNLEQVGRTDDAEGPRVAAVSMTGQDYSDVGAIFEAAGKVVGVAVQKHPQFSDAFFNRSDNQALADLGVPAHTICTAFEFPDYHAVGDHWEKLDYANLEKVNRLVALGILTIADSAKAPDWNAGNTKASPYRKAWSDRRKG